MFLLSLRESQVLNSVDPWLKIRLEWIIEVYRLVGGRATLTSGRRSLSQQRTLYDQQTNRPAAFPGCSQHNYGFAADILFDRIVQITSKGRARIFPRADEIAFGTRLAHHVGLTTVANDDGHVQMYNGIQFKSWAVNRGLCDPNPPPPLASIPTIPGGFWEGLGPDAGDFLSGNFI